MWVYYYLKKIIYLKLCLSKNLINFKRGMKNRKISKLFLILNKSWLFIVNQTFDFFKKDVLILR